MPWFVLYTKARNEKKVSQELNQIGIESYCPTVKLKRKWSDRCKLIDVPLFTSYCFVNIEDKDRQKVFGVQGIVRYLFWLGKPAIVKQSEIETIKLWLNDFDHSSISTSSFSVEDRVILKTGTMIGQTGTVCSVHDKKLILLIENLGMMVTVDTRKTEIEKYVAITHL